MTNIFTKYEMALTDGENAILSLGFTAKRTKRSLFDALIANGPEIIAAAKWEDDGQEFTWDAKNKFYVLPTGHTVRFTGATEKMN